MGPGDQGPTRARGAPPEEVLEGGLSACLGRPVRIVGMEGRPLEERSTYPIDRLRVTLASGGGLPVIFKRLHPAPEPKGNRREVLIYRRLLAGRRFGAPALYASVYDEARERYWLFMEDVGEWTLEQGDLQDWSAAVRWLAQMHGTYLGREQDLRRLHCLGEQGSEYFHRIAETARLHLHLAGPRGALARFERLMARFEAVVAYLARQPRTLVHGDIFPANLLLQPGRGIRPIDWEAAAIGVGAWDLARLLDGWGSDTPTFIAAYLNELARHAAVPFERRAFRLAFAHCEIVNVLWHLGWDLAACRDASFVDGLLDTMETVWHRLDTEAIDA